MLCWNVYVSDFNSREIKVYNIFDQWAFYNDCVRAKRKFKDDREGFAEQVRRDLQYYFWSKCEWEIILDHWPSGEWYEMRQEMKVSDMLDMFKSVGVETKSYIHPDNLEKNATIKVFPAWCKKEQKKIDVYDQVMNNWEIFIDYLWNNRKELKARKS